MKTYECHNPACSLGTVGSPGRFTGGIAPEQVLLLTGKPPEQQEKGVDHGEGVCPNCAQPGEELTAEAQQKRALADAKAAYDEQVAAIKEEVA